MIKSIFKNLLKVQRMSMCSALRQAMPSQTHLALLHTVKTKLDESLVVSEASSLTVESKTKDLCQYYNHLIPEDKRYFLKTLATDYDVDNHLVTQLTSNLQVAKERGPAVLLRIQDRLRHALVPKYQKLFTQISRLEQGVKFLVDLRTDNLNALISSDHDNPHLHAMNTCLRDLLSLWFSVGFLKLERITWESPCDMLQKISEYEAIHRIRNWSDLKRRVGPYRRCYVFTHHSMPREPVVVLHTALTDEISSNIQVIVSRSRCGSDSSESDTTEQEDTSTINTAIFYSITSTQKGLQGVELGNYLIKSVVRELLSEFPRMHQFSSLSPIPGFKEWLLGELTTYLHQHACGEHPDMTLFTALELDQIRSALDSSEKDSVETLRKMLQMNTWLANEDLIHLLEEPLMRLCARYLYVEKRRGYALNPVANFHLRNGAVMWRLNWLADTSPKGLGASCGMMVNYRYLLEQTELNSKRYMETKQIAVSDELLERTKQLPCASPESSR